MSQTLEDPRTKINNEVYAPVFFQRLRELGHVPRTEKQADMLLRIGVTLLDQHARDQVKQANLAEDDLESAYRELAGLAAAFGPPDPQIKAAAARYVATQENLEAATLAAAAVA